MKKQGGSIYVSGYTEMQEGGWVLEGDAANATDGADAGDEVRPHPICDRLWIG